MAEAGVKNRSAYVRKMALDGYVVRLDMTDINELIRLLRSSSNNLNQVAKKANSTQNALRFATLCHASLLKTTVNTILHAPHVMLGSRN